MDAAWNNFFQSTGLSERVIFAVGSVLIHWTVFWGYNAFLYFCYKNNWFPEQRIEKDVFPSQELINENLRELAKNHLLVQPIGIYMIYPLFVSFGLQVYGPLPAWSTVIRDFVVSIALNDTLFYWAHRIFHHASIYKYIHKQHHRYNHSIGIACEFAHPVEDILANLLPTLIGCLLMGSHVFTLWLWLAFRLWETLDVHSGYSWKWSPFSMFSWQGGSERHYFHHSHNVGCYGSFTIFWDWITGKTNDMLEIYFSVSLFSPSLGTDAEFLKYQAAKNAKKNKAN